MVVLVRVLTQIEIKSTSMTNPITDIRARDDVTVVGDPMDKVS